MSSLRGMVGPKGLPKDVHEALVREADVMYRAMWKEMPWPTNSRSGAQHLAG